MTAILEAQIENQEAQSANGFQVRPRCLQVTVAEFVAMDEAGRFADKKVELIGGVLREQEPMNKPHGVSTSRINRVLTRAFDESWAVRCQLPLSLGESGEPLPDFAILPLEDEEAAERHPTTAQLVIEVSDSTVAFDREEKGSLYAEARIPEYWLVNLRMRRLEVRRDPHADDVEVFDGYYGTLQTFDETSRVSPICAPDVSLLISDLLPLQAATSPDTSPEIS